LQAGASRCPRVIGVNSVIGAFLEVVMSAKPIPDGYHSLTPYLHIRGAGRAIEFYKNVFGAKEKLRLDGPNQSVGHAELEIGDSVLMLADEVPLRNVVGPQTLNGTSVGILLYVPNVDDVVARAVAHGARIERPLQNQFYGDRSATVVDPFGHKWTIATHVEDVSDEEMQRRVQNMAKSSS
jgi:PhnB protein